MALITCPDCGQAVSTAASACIHCGRPTAQQAVSTYAPAADGCPFCGSVVMHPNARMGGTVWCERCGARLVYGPGGVLARAVPRAPQPQPSTQVIVIGSRKSVGTAVLLAIFFGPLGMLYSTVGGAVVMFFVNLFVGLATMGFGLLLTWPVCVLWAASAASEHNRRALTVNVVR